MADAPALNREEALATVGGDENLLMDFFRMYDDEEINRCALRLHRGIMKKDFEEIRIGGYLLKSTAGYVGAKKIYALGIELQRKGENKESFDLILKDYMKFLHEAKKAKREIAQILKRPIALNLIDFDIFEQQVITAFPKNFPDSKASPVNSVCDGCNIF